MLNVLRTTAAAAVLIAAPLSASALSVKYFGSAGAAVASLEVFDEGAGDGAAGVVGTLTSVGVGIGGYTISGNFSAIAAYPPIDQMTSTFTVGTGLAGSSARIEVTHYFDNGVPTPLIGLGSAVNNLVSFAGISVTTEVFRADAAYGKDDLISGTAGPVSTSADLFALTSTPYYITQVFTIEGATNGGTATAEWTVPAPIPVPAAGLMLLTALGAAAAMRRKKA